MKLLHRLSPVSIFLCICTVYIAGYFAHAIYLKKTVYGDGIYYYAWLSLHPSKFSIGPAILWAPVYFMAHSEIIVGAISVLAVLFALMLLFYTLSRSFSKTVSLMAVTAIAGATNLLFYGSLDTVNSHAVSFFAATVFIALLSVRRHWFAVGCALGFLGLSRTQDLLYGLLLVPLLNKKNIVPLLTGTLLVFSPQFIAWKLVSGSFFVSPYLIAGEGFNLLKPHILGALFGVHNGLFLWTPVTLLGFVGLALSRRFTMILVFLLELYIVASWSTWWQGASYSGRMFVSTLPILAFGIAEIFSRLAKYRFTKTHYLLTIVLPLTVLNSINIIYFLITLK